MLQMTNFSANSSLSYNTSVNSQDGLLHSGDSPLLPSSGKIFVPEGLQRDECCHCLVYLYILAIIGILDYDERKIEK